jgi:hypothetical protein
MKAGRIVVIVSTALVVAVALMGVYLAEQARIHDLDQQRAHALLHLSDAVERFHEEHGALPASLEALAAATPGLSPSDLRDPQTQAPYVYRATADDAYQLCAAFRTPGVSDEDIRGRRGRDRGCFHFTTPRPVTLSVVPPLKRGSGSR